MSYPWSLPRVRQRGTSHLLFNTVVYAIMREVFKGKCGVLRKIVTDLMSTDDSAIFSDAEATAFMQINADKTKVLTTDGSRTNLHFDGFHIK